MAGGVGKNSSNINRLRGVRQRHWGSWVSEIRHPISKRRVWLGTFPSREEAVRAYDTAAWMLCGPKAKTNAEHSPLSLIAASAAASFSPALRRKLQRCSLESSSAAAAASSSSGHAYSACNDHHKKSSTNINSKTVNAKGNRAPARPIDKRNSTGPEPTRADYTDKSYSSRRQCNIVATNSSAAASPACDTASNVRPSDASLRRPTTSLPPHRRADNSHLNADLVESTSSGCSQPSASWMNHTSIENRTPYSAPKGIISSSSSSSSSSPSGPLHHDQYVDPPFLMLTDYIHHPSYPILEGRSYSTNSRENELNYMNPIRSSSPSKLPLSPYNHKIYSTSSFTSTAASIINPNHQTNYYGPAIAPSLISEPATNHSPCIDSMLPEPYIDNYSATITNHDPHIELQAINLHIMNDYEHHCVDVMDQLLQLQQAINDQQLMYCHDNCSIDNNHNARTKIVQTHDSYTATLNDRSDVDFRNTINDSANHQYYQQLHGLTPHQYNTHHSKDIPSSITCADRPGDDDYDHVHLFHYDRSSHVNGNLLDHINQDDYLHSIILDDFLS